MSSLGTQVSKLNVMYKQVTYTVCVSWVGGHLQVEFGSQNAEGVTVGHAGGRSQRGGDNPGPVGTSIGTGGTTGPGSRVQGYFLSEKGRWAPRDAPHGVPVAPPGRANLVLIFPPFFVVLKSLGGGFSLQTHNSGFTCFSCCVLLKISVFFFIRTTTGANPSFPPPTPKPAPAKTWGSAGLGVTWGAKRGWGQGTERHGDPKLILGPRCERGQRRDPARGPK